MPRVMHFEIQGSPPEEIARFYSELFGWKFNRWGEMDYWLIETGSSEAPGINGGLMPRHGGAPVDGQGVNAFVCVVDVPSVDDYLAKALTLGATVAVPKMPVPTVGWLSYIKDPAGNILGMMQMDPAAK